MNIREAKDEIKKSVKVYLEKNAFGEYAIPVSKQRPMFLMGAPGIGKTAIMRQIASELDIALVTCSMTHHTRQSALGRPVIGSGSYGGKKEAVSEYTMSEILAAVYQVMQDSGKKEGILFVDEINRVPEKLDPAVRLFLQYKILGKRQVPEGWIVVTAGSPPRYDRSVREFGIDAMDRLKQIDISEDFSAWKQYAHQEGIHAAMITFLEIHPQWFCSIRSGADGMRYATARGWEDLSTETRLFEEKGFEVNKRLTGQYITDPEIAEGFGTYYGLYRKYKAEYPIADILSGKVGGDIIEKLQTAKMEESFAVLGLIMEMLGEGLRKAARQEQSLLMAAEALSSVRKVIKKEKIPVSLLLQEQIDRLRKQLRERTAANSIMDKEREVYLAVVRLLKEYEDNPDTKDLKKDFERIRKLFGRKVKQYEKQLGRVKYMQESAESFAGQVWRDRPEMAELLEEFTSDTEKIFPDHPGILL